MVAESCCGWLVCVALSVILFCEGCVLHAEPALSNALADELQVAHGDAAWPLYAAKVTGFLVGPVVGFLSKLWPGRLLLVSCLAACLSMACCYVASSSLTYWTLLLGVAFGASCGATRIASVLIVNSCCKQYRSIGNGLSVTGEALALYVGSPIVGGLFREYGVRGAVLILTGVLFNTCALASFLNRLSFDTSESPEDEQPQLALVRKRSDLEYKVIMEQPTVTAISEEENSPALTHVSLCSECASDDGYRKRGKSNLVICVAIIEHRRGSDSESDDGELLSRSPHIGDGWRGQRRKSSHTSGNRILLVQRRSWNYEGLISKRRMSFVEKWISSSIECLRASCQPESAYLKLEELEASSSIEKAESDLNLDERKTSQESLFAVVPVSSDSSSSSHAMSGSGSSPCNFTDHARSSGQHASSEQGSDVQDAAAYDQSSSPGPASPDSELTTKGLPRRDTEISLENGDLENGDLLNNLDVPGVPVKRRYSRLAQDILLRQLQEKNRPSGHWLIFRNPCLYLVCVASCVMFNSVAIFLTKLADVLRTKSIPTSMDEKLFPMFCLGNLVACLCSGWFTDEGHISVRRAIAVDFSILGTSMLIVNLHTSVNTFAIQSLLQGWAFGQANALSPVLLVKALGLVWCGFAFGVVLFATGVSVLCRQLLMVHFKSSFGTQAFIFNFHGILALTIAGMFLVETRFNRAIVRSRTPRAQEL